MSERFLVRIEVWPHSTSRGQDIDQIQAGARSHSFEVKAHDIAGALACADLIVKGVATNPIVWQAPIKEVRQLGHDERVRHDFEQHDRELHAAARLQMPAANPRTSNPTAPADASTQESV